MSRNDITIRETGGLNSVPTDRWVVAAGTPPTIKAGEPCKQNATADENVILLVDDDLTVATDNAMAGVAAVDSSEVAATAGYVDVYCPLPGVKWEIKATTASTVDSQSEIDALIGQLQAMDLISSVFTMNTAATASTNAFLIVGGDPDRSTVLFRIRPDACSFGRASV